MIKGRPPGVVAAIDITIDQLTNTIGRYRITPSAAALLIDAEGQTLAYRDPENLIPCTASRCR